MRREQSALWGDRLPVRETSPAGPRLETLPSLSRSNIAIGLNAFSLFANVALILALGLTILNVGGVIVALSVIWFMCMPGRRMVIKERNEARARNLQAVVDHWDGVDMLELVPPSVGLAELDAQLEALEKAPPLNESNRARKRRVRREAQEEREANVQVAQQEAEELKRKIIAAHRTPTHAIPKGTMVIDNPREALRIQTEQQRRLNDSPGQYHRRAQLEAIAGRRSVANMAADREARRQRLLALMEGDDRTCRDGCSCAVCMGHTY